MESYTYTVGSVTTAGYPHGYYLETRNRNKSYTDPSGSEVYGTPNPEKTLP